MHESITSPEQPGRNAVIIYIYLYKETSCLQDGLLDVPFPIALN